MPMHRIETVDFEYRTDEAVQHKWLHQVQARYLAPSYILGSGAKGHGLTECSGLYTDIMRDFHGSGQPSKKDDVPSGPDSKKLGKKS